MADPIDKDMSGASIFAVKEGTGADGPPVDIAVAWGQDPSVSRLRQELSMDMGYVVLPFTNLKVAKLVDKNFVDIGGQLTYTIRITNVGNRNVQGGTVTVKDVLDTSVSYVPGSVVMKYNFGNFTTVTINDSATGTPFPLDNSGFVIPLQIPRRGAFVDITFRVQIDNNLTGKSRIVNKGTLSQPDTPDIPYETTTIIDYKPSVAVDNVVVLGSDGSKCQTDGNETVSERPGSNVTYCFKITNTGQSHLVNIQVNNLQLGNYSQQLQTSLAPGASTTVVTTQKIVDGTNAVVIIASPAYSTGLEIFDATRVTATDSSSAKVVPFKPNILIDNKVYIGVDGNGSMCNSMNATDSVVGIFQTPVTYCFTVKNVGDTWLNQLYIENKALNYSFDLTGTMAPNETRSVFFESSVTQDLNNMAVVSGQPVDSTGLVLPQSSKVVNQDPSSVEKLLFNPNILVENTVYLGHDGGEKCGTTAAVEFVSDFVDSPVTYCFKIINTGDTALSYVSIVNNDISYSNNNVGTIARGGSVLLHHDGTISQSKKNVATVNGAPVLDDGRVLGDLSEVSSSDPSEVGRKTSTPSVIITNSIVLGRNSDCNTNTFDSVEGFQGTNITYCFLVKNNGNSYLDNIVVFNEQLAFNATLPILAPGLTSMITLPGQISESLQNIATVTANPTSASGIDLSDVADVSSSDPSSIALIAFQPAVELANKVYLGSEEAKSCGTAVEVVQGMFGDDVTYCFNVTNTGNTYLKNFRVENTELAFTGNYLTTLAPGQSTLIAVGRKIIRSFNNTATIVATPSDSNGDSILIPDIGKSDTSSVGRIAHVSTINIDNKVYRGTISDDLCGTINATEYVLDIYKTDIVYCFRITNSGDSYLSDILVESKAMNFIQRLNTSLAPGATTLLKVPGSIVSTVQTVATVTANPSLHDGSDIEGMPNVTSTDTSSVGKLNYVARVLVDNTVYKGLDGTRGCSSASNSITALFGTDITYCFRITNTGNTTLKNVLLTNALLVYAETLVVSLPPGVSVLVSFPGRMTSAFTNTLNVAASPTTNDGRSILDLADATHSDTSSVGLLSHTPKISVSNTVYLGSGDGGAKCAFGVEMVQAGYNSEVTYCFTIRNDGNTYFNDVSLSNQILGHENVTIGVLAPNASTTYSVGGLITGTMLNTAIVKGSPSLQDGSSIPNTVVASASDTSSITQISSGASVNIENTVYIGADGGAACNISIAENVVGYPRTAVTYCLEVKNTGNTSLANITVVDVNLQINDRTIIFLAPGTSRIITVPGIISANVTNNATVSANPALMDGRKIPNDPIVTDSDTSSVEVKAFAPAIKINNVVGIGHGGGSCATARDLQEGFYGDEITYCFLVTNVGDTVLLNTTIVDAVLSYSGIINLPLAPGESTTLSVDSTIVADITNVAVVSAVPAHSDLTAIAGLSRVEHHDQSTVNKFDLKGGVKIENIVYDSRLPGSSCTSGLTSIEAKYGMPVQYCFTVTNTGETHLNGIVLSNIALGYLNNTLNTLAPGETFTVSVPGKVTESKENVAIVTANPITASGKDILDLGDVSSNDASSISLIPSVAGITITNKVYIGVDGGVSCSSENATHALGGYFGVPITYCFTVTNTGETLLSNVTITNEEIGFFDDSSITTIAPGETETVSFPSKILRSLQNTAIVSSLASIQDGSIIPGMAPVTSSDDSTISRIPHIPSIDIANTVYVGDGTSNDGQSYCGSIQAVEHVEQFKGTIVTYCFEISNKGDTFLNNVIVSNEELSYEERLTDMLAPGDKKMIMLTTALTDTLLNTAVVTANPTLADGTDIPDLNNVTWTDSSSVSKLNFFANVTVDNLVYIGDDNDGASCGNHTAAMQSVSGRSGSKVIYCFNITNNGDVYLKDVTMTNYELVYENTSTSLLAPQASKLMIFKSEITGNMTNIAVITAYPAMANGALIADGTLVTASDSSEVTLISGLNGDDRNGANELYKSPTNSSSCLYDTWLTSPGVNFEAGDLLCVTNEVFVETLSAQNASTCGIGETITLTLDATINIDSSRNDLGWYIATDGGDALTGTCVVNGLQDNGGQYELLDTNTVGNSTRIEWTSLNGGDDDECGDVLMYGNGHAALSLPILVETTLPCQDENDNGSLDIAICFTWKDIGTDDVCTFSGMIPTRNTGCYCTRVDVVNVEVVVPNVVAPIELC